MKEERREGMKEKEETTVFVFLAWVLKCDLDQFQAKHIKKGRRGWGRREGGGGGKQWYEGRKEVRNKRKKKKERNEDGR